VLLLIPVDEFPGLPRGPCSGIVGAEEGTVAVLAAELHRLGRSPSVAPHDGFVESQLMGLLNDEGHLVVVLGGEEKFRAGVLDLGELELKSVSFVVKLS